MKINIFLYLLALNILHKTWSKRLNTSLSNEYSESSEYQKRNIRQVPNPLAHLQEQFLQSKHNCAKKLGLNSNQLGKILLFENEPSEIEKYWLSCIFKQTGIMSNNNKLDGDKILNIVRDASNNNELVVSIVMSFLTRCNSTVTSTGEGDAAMQINNCIAQELKKHNIKITY